MDLVWTLDWTYLSKTRRNLCKKNRRQMALKGQIWCSEALIRTRWFFVVLRHWMKNAKKQRETSRMRQSSQSTGWREVIYLLLASPTLVRSRARSSSLKRQLSSIRPLSCNADLDNRPTPARTHDGFKEFIMIDRLEEDWEPILFKNLSVLTSAKGRGKYRRVQELKLQR
jgi:hypothetical protein